MPGHRRITAADSRRDRALPVPIIAAGQKLTGLVAEKVAGQGAVDRLDALRTAVKAVQP
jgi:hypothetical protein